DRVRVAGKAGEYSGMTQVTSVSNLLVCDSNNGYSTIEVSLPFSQADEPEFIEGMSIQINQTLTVSENYNLGRYGELVLSNGRLMNPTNVVSPGTEANAMQQQNDLNRITLDDGSTRQNPGVIKFPQPELSAFNTVRGGDSVSNLVGVMHQAFGAYRIQATQNPDFAISNPRSQYPQLEQAPLKVASFNVLNYFNGDGEGGGYPTPRGADNAEEFERQRTKIISAVAAMEADVIGLMEIENDGYLELSAIADLVNGVNQSTGKIYDYVRPTTTNGLLGSDAIAVGIIFDTAKVEQAGVAATLDSGAFEDKNRQPLAQSFRELDSNGKFTVVVNHFKSKGSCPSDISDINADQGDGQGCWNAMRSLAAQQIVAWLASSPTGVEDSDNLIIGDLNAYAMEDPVASIEQSGYENLIKKFEGNAGYSYVFYGQAGALDHALSSPSLTSQVVDTTEWHINTDEPKVLDYNVEYKSTSQVTGLYSADHFRASDHDPVIVALNLKPGTDVNNDGRLNVRDIIAVIRHFRKNASGKNRKYDLNQDEKINFRDLIEVLRAIHKARRSR
ncbi:MAG: ExeM/NucH family extracellular endonuclease, partial [Kangiellaceae bacterium]|nr:ExeM/NucH family extracellular endonuclease [Kangiellaceae bacterium]